jgi:hypothetical protein
MPSRVVVQPNGKYAVFSTVVGHFTHYDHTRDEMLEVFLEKCGRSCAEEKVQRGDGNPQRFEDEINTIRIVHGDLEADAARAYLSGLSNTPSLMLAPIDEVDQ